MSVKAVAAYFDRYIEVNNMKIGATLDAAGGIGSNYLRRVMRGLTKEPSASNLRKIAKQTGASWEIVGRLLDSDEYDIKDGQEAADDPVGWLRKHATDETTQTILDARSQNGNDKIADELEEMARRIRGGLE